MKWAFAISLFLALAIGLIAQDVIVKVDIPQPGQRGMISVAGENDLQVGDASLLRNMVINETYGNVTPRRPLWTYGGNTKQLYGACGYYNPYTDHKLIVGIGDSLYTWYDSGRVRSAVVGQFYVTDTFGTTVNRTVSGYAFPHRFGNHQWQQHLNFMTHCDGKNLPVLFTTTSSGKYKDSLDDTLTYEPRTLPIGLNAPGQLLVGISEVPSKITGNYQYAYCYVDTATSSGDSTGGLSIPTGIIYIDNYAPYVTQFDPYIYRDGTSGAGGDKGSVLLCRKKLDGRGLWYAIDTIDWDGPSFSQRIYDYAPGYDDKWPTTGILTPLPNHTYRIRLYNADKTDSGTTTITTTGDLSVWTTRGNALGITPMEFLSESLATVFDTMVLGGGNIDAYRIGTHIQISNTKNVATWTIGMPSHTHGHITGYHPCYLYGPSDRTTANKFPPIVYIDTIPDSVATKAFDTSRVHASLPTPGKLFNLGLTAWYAPTVKTRRAYPDSTYGVAYSYIDPTTGLESPRGFTAYQELTDSSSVNDSTKFRQFETGFPATGRPKWIRLYQTVNKTGLTGAGDTLVWYALCDMRTGDSDQTIIWGNWSDDAVATLGLDRDSISTHTVYDWQVPKTASGDPIQQPPYVYDNQIPFSQIVKAHDRFWAIGDPQYPSRLYWSSPDTMWNWNPLAYFRVDEGVSDELVSLGEVNGELYMLKHNSVWSLGGYDPEYDANIYKVTSGLGVASAKTAITRADAMWFLSPSLKMYRLGSDGLNDISQPVENWIDTLFNTYVDAASNARMFPLGDAVKLLDDSTQDLMSYNYQTQMWSKEDYAADPSVLGSFRYDSTMNLSGFGFYSDLVFYDSTVAFRSESRSTMYPDYWDANNLFRPLHATEMYLGGDGVHLWQAEEIILTINNYLATITSLEFVSIYDRPGGTELCRDSIIMASSGLQTYVIHPNPQSAPARWLYLKFWGNEGDKTAITSTGWGCIEVVNVEVSLRNCGLAAVNQ